MKSEEHGKALEIVHFVTSQEKGFLPGYDLRFCAQHMKQTRSSTGMTFWACIEQYIFSYYIKVILTKIKSVIHMLLHMRG